MPDRLMLLDTPTLYYRAYFGVPTTVCSPRGEPVNAVRGVLDMLGRLVTDHRPDALVAAMDHDWRPAFRVALVPSYKTHRVADDGAAELTEDDLSPQVAILEAVLAALGIAVVGAAGLEADDVIGTLAARHRGPVDIVSGDRDLFQLVDDARGVRVLYTQKGLANLAAYDEAAVTARYGIPGRAYADFALLRGDPSDGLPGVPGVGEKTAAKLIAAHGSLEGLLAALDAGALAPATAAKLAAARAYVLAARGVVRIVTDAPLPDIPAALPRAPADPARLGALSERWGLFGPLDRLTRALAARGSSGDGAASAS